MFGWTAIGIGSEAVGYGLADDGCALPGHTRFGLLRSTTRFLAAIIIIAVTGASLEQTTTG